MVPLASFRLSLMFHSSTSGHVENSRAFSRYRDIDEEMAKEAILKLE